ncbi:MAG: ATP-grasp domain-containing protein [Planctomycetia bacterium]|nr:MAG: ATP-grasp domain-containing protein [Planctomycetia bacterium]
MTRARSAEPLTILFTCVGRRIELMQAFRAAAARLGVPLRVAAVDRDATAPGLHCADVAEIVPRADEPDYLDHLTALLQRTGGGLVLPTTDTDLGVISRGRDALIAAGGIPLIGPPEVIETCRDKLRTFEFLTRHGIDTPRTQTPEQLGALPQHGFPCFVKPRFGSASESAHRADDPTDLAYFLAKGRSPIVQEFVAGEEFTLDVYVGLSGEARCVVPRLRWQVRGGEVSKGVVVRDSAIMDAGMRVAKALGGGLRGVVTLQCIRTADGAIRFIEINPRFGGGAPLAIAAGADFPLWLLQEHLGESPQIDPQGFRHGVCTLRYDWSAFVDLAPDLKPRLGGLMKPFPHFE